MIHGRVHHQTAFHPYSATSNAIDQMVTGPKRRWGVHHRTEWEWGWLCSFLCCQQQRCRREYLRQQLQRSGTCAPRHWLSRQILPDVRRIRERQSQRSERHRKCGTHWSSTKESNKRIEGLMVDHEHLKKMVRRLGDQWRLFGQTLHKDSSTIRIMRLRRVSGTSTWANRNRKRTTP